MKRVALSVVALATVAGAVAPASSKSRYLEPEREDGMVFPVARTDWYSVINFSDDWHAPRMRFIAGRWRQVGIHEGTDVFAEPGTPVYAIAPGTVERVGWTFYSGWRVGIRDADGRYWFYAHLRSYPDDAWVGQPVSAGTVIGRVGNTGYGARPGHRDEFPHHLHVGIQSADGAWVNPYPLLRRLYRVAVEDDAR